MITRTLDVLCPIVPLPPAPYPTLFTSCDKVIPVWGPVDRPLFVIDESELPY